MEMTRFISFDMDGTLIDPEFTDWVWGHGIPTHYSRRSGLPFEKAKAFVEQEYQKVGEGAIEWYDIKYWIRFFKLEVDWRSLMEQFAHTIKSYPDVNEVLDHLRGRFPLALTSNAGREFIDLEMEATGLGSYFSKIFSATSDFGLVKKTARFYRDVCRSLGVAPEEILHVGDHYEFDYLVPRSMGIHAFYLDRSGQHQGEFILSNLGQLEERLLAQAG
jgi:putative hydrolase of the HAD superfamily